MQYLGTLLRSEEHNVLMLHKKTGCHYNVRCVNELLISSNSSQAQRGASFFFAMFVSGVIV